MVDLEKLYTEQWSRTDGVGALIITPTRELAYQVIKEGGYYVNLMGGFAFFLGSNKNIASRLIQGCLFSVKINFFQKLLKLRK